MSQLPFRENLEEFNNPDEVRRRLAAGKYRAPIDAAIAQEYLDSIDRKEAALVAARAEAREDKMLLIASAAADSARLAARWAMWAAIIAITAITIATKDHILALIFGNL